MSVTIVTRDETALPADLLAPAKAFMRIDVFDDDEVIAGLIAAAIDHFERTRGMTIHPTQYAWDSIADFDGAIDITPDQRITPISAWQATIPGANSGDPPLDVTSQYSMSQQGLHGAVFYSLN